MLGQTSKTFERSLASQHTSKHDNLYLSVNIQQKILHVRELCFFDVISWSVSLVRELCFFDVISWSVSLLRSFLLLQ